MSTLEEDIEALALSGNVTPQRATQLVLKHTKRVRSWPRFLRRLADALEQQPELFELSPRAVGKIIEEVLSGSTDPV